MKLALLSFTCLMFIFFTKLTHAAERPLLGKYNYPGYVMPEHAIVESCEVFTGGHILKSVTLDREIKSQEQFKLQMGVEQLQSLIAQAKSEEIKLLPNYMCDGPSTVIRAYGDINLGPQGTLMLFSSGGCGAEEEKRIGPATMALRDIVQEHCPEVHVFSRDSE